MKFIAVNCKDKELIDYLNKVQKDFAANPQCGQTTFLSVNFIRKVVLAIGAHIQEKIKETIEQKCNSEFAIQVDTSTDNAVKNQCALVVRYVTYKFEINNRIVSIAPLNESTGKAIFDFVEKQIIKLGLSTKNIVASCTDGAANMSSASKGLSGLLQVENPLHIYTWCVCHRYNLVIQAAISLDNSLITDVLKELHETAVFIRASPKRMDIWVSVITNLAETYKDINIQKRPVVAGNTRWWAQYKALNHLMKNESCFLTTLLTMQTLSEFKRLTTEQQNSINKSISNCSRIYASCKPLLCQLLKSFLFYIPRKSI